MSREIPSEPALSSFQGVIFDLDGTLIDSLLDIAEAANFALTRLGFLPHPVESYRYFVGEGARKLIERVLPENSRDLQTVDECLAVYQDRYREFWNVHTRPYPGINEMLDLLTERRVHLAVLTNKPDELARLYVHEWFAKRNFDPIFGAGKERPLKPDPSGALEIAKTLRISPRDFIFVGDTRTDIETARAAGMTAIGALWGFRTRQELEAAGADAVISSPLGLLKLLR